MKKGEFISAVKIHDDRFEDFHPTFINVGDNVQGYLKRDIVVGKRVKLYHSPKAIVILHTTTKVTKIKDNKFYTKNCVFQIDS